MKIRKHKEIEKKERKNKPRIKKRKKKESKNGKKHDARECGGVECLCSHETLPQCCDSFFPVRVVELVVSVLISTLTSHAGLESYQSQTHLPCAAHV